MLVIKDKKVILRDFIESDIPKRIHWETTQREWQLWDAPWEYENLTEAEANNALKNYIESMKIWVQKYQSMPGAEKRTGFQICTTENVYIGWCNSYTIDDDYRFSRLGDKRAIGIDIPERSQRSKGYAYHALCLFTDYLLARGETQIYTQTWSGNERMIALAHKLGFEECCRKKGIRTVRGSIYDGLTFRLNKSTYAMARCVK